MLRLPAGKAHFGIDTRGRFAKEWLAPSLSTVTWPDV